MYKNFDLLKIVVRSLCFLVKKLLLIDTKPLLNHINLIFQIAQLNPPSLFMQGRLLKWLIRLGNNFSNTEVAISDFSLLLLYMISVRYCSFYSFTLPTITIAIIVTLSRSQRLQRYIYFFSSLKSDIYCYSNS